MDVKWRDVICLDRECKTRFASKGGSIHNSRGHRSSISFFNSLRCPHCHCVGTVLVASLEVPLDSPFCHQPHVWLSFICLIKPSPSQGGGL